MPDLFAGKFPRFVLPITLMLAGMTLAACHTVLAQEDFFKTDPRTGKKTVIVPYCRMTSPKNYARFPKPTTIRVTADARSNVKEPVVVTFLLWKPASPDDPALQTIVDKQPPFSADFAPVPPGEYRISAAARRPSLGVEVWDGVTVIVGDGKAAPARKGN